ncbi:MATE family efflux transporter [Bacteriovorax sp. Seq25_V]|uniref:MATE family efflux transporter n=1 Tax=Bacteriovorax sp. Seq25_V TaxID=1201288 RepID=UPI00038A2700|nr:MATE family efflux transporter [Bacteriovorax sp. Seq25_V]EQC46083.1 MATE efflux family protein [Bacteriovorax sp. Seq25_V]
MEKNWNTYKGLWALSFPSILASMLEPLSSVVDTALVGRFDTNFLAALAIGVSVISSLTWMFNFLVHAPIQRISQLLGKGDLDSLRSTAKFSMLLAFALGILLIIIFYPLRGYIYAFMSVDPTIVAQTDVYFSYRLFGQVFILLFTVNLAILRGLAKVNSAFLYIFIATTINIIFSYLSLYHLDLGLKGVAIGTVLGNFVGFICSFIEILRDKNIGIGFLSAHVDKESKLSVVRASANIFGRSFFLTTCFFLSTKVASHIGVVELAAHQILLQIWLFASFFTDGVATTGNIVCARLSGEKRKGELRNILKKINLLGMIIGFIFALTYAVFPYFVLGRFTEDVSVLSKINEVWIYIVISQMPLAVAYVLDGHMFGMNKFGDLKNYMMMAFFLLFLPIIYFAYTLKSLQYVWIAIIAVGLFRLITNQLTIYRELNK